MSPTESFRITQAYKHWAWTLQLYLFERYNLSVTVARSKVEYDSGSHSFWIAGRWYKARAELLIEKLNQSAERIQLCTTNRVAMLEDREYHPLYRYLATSAELDSRMARSLPGVQRD